MEEFISQQGQAIAKDSTGNKTDLHQNQRSTHREILKFGSQIYERKCAELEKLREQSLSELEERVWVLANEDKENAVKQTYEHGRKELLQQKEISKKEKDKAVRAECKRVEAYMKKQAAEQLQKVGEEFQVKLKEALHDARIEFEVEKMLAIRETREDEINHAVEDAARVADLEDKARKKIVLEAEKEKAEALKTLKLRMKQEAETAIEETKKQCHGITLEELRKCEDRHRAELEKLNQEIVQMDKNYAGLKAQIAEKENIIRKTETKLREVVQEFQQFIDLTKGFSKGQSEYLLPDINLLQDMLKGVVSSYGNKF